MSRLDEHFAAGSYRSTAFIPLNIWCWGKYVRSICVV